MACWTGGKPDRVCPISTMPRSWIVPKINEEFAWF